MPRRFERPSSNKTWVVRITTLMAALVALTIATALPATYFQLRNTYYHGKLDADANNLAYRITQLVSEHPLMWRFRSDMLDEIVQRFIQQENVEQQRITIYAGDEVAIRSGLSDEQIDASWHVVRVSQPVYDSGRAIGRVEISAALNAMVARTSLLGLAMAVLGVVVFLVLRNVPLRALDGAMREVSYLASHDSLTNLPNRVLFRDRLQQALKLAERRSERIAVICLDLDHFKDVNDTLGHAAGDELLRQATDRIRDVIRTSDTLARLGGDEFAIIQIEHGQPEGAAALAQRIIDALAQPFMLRGHEAVIGSSVGIAVYPIDEIDPDNLLRSADLALYSAKADGRGVYRFFEEAMNSKLRQRKSLEAALRRALAEDQFELYYQPQIELDGESITGVEALIRWHDPEHGMISPADFIPLAEETGIIIPITEWALRRACRDTRDWGGLSVAVNLSPVVFKHKDLVQLVSSILSETGFDPRRLELEITETSLLQETERALATLKDIKKLGVRVAMDDFGTGYSSLSYLQQFPFDKIKIDRSFISNLTKDGDAVAIVGAVINLGRSLGMATTAEGVETADQAAFLADQGCEEVQGFYFARPMPAADLASFITARDAEAVHGVHQAETRPNRTAA